LPHEAKALLELFCLEPNMIGRRQNSSSRAFVSLSKIDTAFWHFTNSARQCLFCHQRRKHCGSYFAVSRIRLVGLVKWQGLHTWISIRSLEH